MTTKIIAFIQEQGEASPKDIAEFLSISRQMTHRYLKDLLHNNKIIKIGTAPNVFYKVLSNKETAVKLIKRSLAKKVFGLAITGSYKDFEVITEA